MVEPRTTVVLGANLLFGTLTIPITLLCQCLSDETLCYHKGPFKCYVTQMGWGGCQIFRKKALRRCNVQCY